MVLGSVKNYSLVEISLKMFENKKWSFEELSSKKSNIEKKIKEVLTNGGFVYALHRKKVLKAVYLFKLVTEDDKKSILFDCKVLVDELTTDVIDEYENDIVTFLGELVSEGEYVKAVFNGKEIEPVQVKLGKWQIPILFLWLIVGVVLSILLKDSFWIPIFLCLGLSSGYIVDGKTPSEVVKKKTTEKKLKSKKGK